ncbi:MAG: tetratricopeptide repeat protein [Acidobacteriota bacterium]
MRPVYLLALITLLLPGGAFAASKEMQEMQRDIAQLQAQVQSLQSSVDTKLAAIQALLQQSLDAGNKANTGVAVLSSTVNQTLDRELNSKLAPIAALAAKVDNTNNDVSEVRQQVSDMNSSINKVLQKLNDVNEAVKVLQAPAPPPPGATPNFQQPAAQIPAETLFNNALKDYAGGKYDLAISEFSDFIKFYPDNPNAANAQLNIGEAHSAKGQYELAAQDFDAVIERYPSNEQVTPNAYFDKGMALKAIGRKTEAIATFRALIAKYPRKDQASQAKEQLRAMGVSITAPAPPSASKRKSIR